MNQPEPMVSGVSTPLSQLKGQLLNKGYSYREIQEEDAVLVIFKASTTDPQSSLISMLPITEN